MLGRGHTGWWLDQSALKLAGEGVVCLAKYLIGEYSTNAVVLPVKEIL